MYPIILMTLDRSSADRGIIEHIKKLAKAMNSKVVLFHVATGVPAQMHGPDATGREITDANAYLAKIHAEFESLQIPVEQVLAFGDPVTQIIQWTQGNPCDLIAMGTHGHRMIADLLLGATASRVQHSVLVPVLMLRVPPNTPA